MREPVSGHEVVKKKKDCNNLEKETVGLEKVKVIARIHTDFPTKFGVPRQSGLSDAAGLVVFVGYPSTGKRIYLANTYYRAAKEG